MRSNKLSQEQNNISKKKTRKKAPPLRKCHQGTRGTPPGIINKEDAPPRRTNNNNIRDKEKDNDKDRNIGTPIITSEHKTEEEAKFNMPPTEVVVPPRETNNPPNP